METRLVAVDSSPHSDAGVRISVEVGNVGDAPGVATVGVEIDDEFVAEADSDQLSSGESAPVFVDLGRLGPGLHTILVAPSAL